MRDTHVLCNHYQLRYSTIIYYTSKRYSSCQCTLCARCRCSDDIDFASPCLPSTSSRGQPQSFSLPLSLPIRLLANPVPGSLAARATRYRMVTMVPCLRKARSHRDDIVRTTCCGALASVKPNYCDTTMLSPRDPDRSRPIRRRRSRIARRSALLVRGSFAGGAEVGKRAVLSNARLCASPLGSLHLKDFGFRGQIGMRETGRRVPAVGSKSREFFLGHDGLNLASPSKAGAHARERSHGVKPSPFVKPCCVTHDIYKGFSIRKTHIIEITCNILSYAVIQ